MVNPGKESNAQALLSQKCNIEYCVCFHVSIYEYACVCVSVCKFILKCHLVSTEICQTWDCLDQRATSCPAYHQ